MIASELAAVAAAHGASPDFEVTLSIPGGEEIARHTWNPRLGILGGLSILGTTGIVIPYSCSAWIHSIHRGIDVARAAGLDHVVGATGDRSEKAAMARLGLPIEAYIDLGDFVGGMLKYVRAHPVARVTIAGGFAKLCKLMQGARDLHSARSSVDLGRLAEAFAQAGGPAAEVAAIPAAGSAAAALAIGGPGLAEFVARGAREAAQGIVGAETRGDILIVDTGGSIVGESGRMKILVLGGTAEARELCAALVRLNQEVTLSLAGRTTDPEIPEGCAVRIGGFGGVEFLAAYIQGEAFDRVVDATHPYAVQMSANAARAAETTGVPLVRLTRPGWVEPQYAFWRWMPDFDSAAAELPAGSRAFLTIGHRGLEPFYARNDCTFLIRTIEMPDWLPPHCWAIQTRPPYYVSTETELMRNEKITHLVTKDSGGVQTEAKLYAAQKLGLSTIVIQRPVKPEVREYNSIGRAIAALRLEGV
jgi:precorrin-6x reductase